MALQHGASLVPVLSFGENNLFYQVANPRGSVLRLIQDVFQRIFRFAVPLVFLPGRTPVFTVVGAPIDVPMTVNITDDLVEKIHAKYVKALENLYEDHRAKYDPKAPPRITFVA